MQTLLDLLRDIDIYMSQHAIYISKLERALENKEPFEHKTCRDCNFGKKFYQDIYPYIGDYDENIKEIILEIEKIHCEFHEIAAKIDTVNPKPEDIEIVKAMKDKSAKLFQELLKLKRKVLKGE